MLVLSRFKNEVIVIDLEALVPLVDSQPQALKEILSTPLEITVVDLKYPKVDRAKVRLGISAHPNIPTHRQEVQERIKLDEKRLKGGLER